MKNCKYQERGSYEQTKKGTYMNKMNVAVLLIALNACSLYAEANIVLDSEVLHLADGHFFNADTIEYMRKFNRKILCILLGNLQPDGTRIGRYTLGGIKHNVRDLVKIEKDLVLSQQASHENEAWQELQSCMEQAKADFMETSQEFLSIAMGAKSILTKLIDEFCQKANRTNSLMREWASITEGEEDILFKQKMHYFRDFYQFCIDLLNFAKSLTNSCPKAQEQFHSRVAKWAKAKEILPLILKKEKIEIENNHFLKYIKENHLDHCTLEEITQKKITSFFHEFLKKRSALSLEDNDYLDELENN